MNKKIFISCLIPALSGILATSVAVIGLIYVNLTAAAIAVVAGCVLTSAVLYNVCNKVSSEIAENVSRISVSHPDRNTTYPELAPLCDSLEENNRLVSQHIAGLEAEHHTQDDMRREFTANVSHELKTPLTSISGYAEIIRDGIARGEDVKRFAGKIHDESGRLITLVGDIIKLSQLEANDLGVKLEELDLYEMCEGVIGHLEHAAQKKNVTLSLSGEHIFIRGAEQIVEEIIFNICDNAVKYNKEGGKVDISIRQCVDGVELSVSDTGIGIANDDIDHIFERFYRADKSHSKEIGGTGLGLSIVKHGVRFMGASVYVESELGKGTTVRILF